MARERVFSKGDNDEDKQGDVDDDERAGEHLRTLEGYGGRQGMGAVEEERAGEGAGRRTVRAGGQEQDRTLDIQRASNDGVRLGVDSTLQYATEDVKATATRALTAPTLPPPSRHEHRSLLPAPGLRSETPSISMCPPFSTWEITAIMPIFLPDIVITNNDDDDT